MAKTADAITHEDVLNKFKTEIGITNPPTIYWNKYQAIEAMIVWAKIKTASLQAELDGARKRINELTMADMTHEYKDAEAERFRPEYERQIKEPLEQEIARLKGLVEIAYQDAADNAYTAASLGADFDTEVRIKQFKEQHNI